MSEQNLHDPAFSTRSEIEGTFQALGLVSDAERQRYQAFAPPAQRPLVRVFVASNTGQFEASQNA
jgi:hypothetical protein